MLLHEVLSDEIAAGIDRGFSEREEFDTIADLGFRYLDQLGDVVMYYWKNIDVVEQLL